MKKKLSGLLLFGVLTILLGLSFIPMPVALPMLYIWRIAVVLAMVNRFLKPIHLSPRFFLAMGGLILFFIVSFLVPLLFPVAQALVVVLIALILTDVFLLFNKKLQVKKYMIISLTS